MHRTAANASTQRMSLWSGGRRRDGSYTGSCAPSRRTRTESLLVIAHRHVVGERVTASQTRRGIAELAFENSVWSKARSSIPASRWVRGSGPCMEVDEELVGWLGVLPRQLPAVGSGDAGPVERRCQQS